MKKRWIGSGLLAAATLCVISCQAEPPGQVILAIQTDMSLPKDIDQIRIVVSYADTGGIVFQNNYNNFTDPTADGYTPLPATLSIVGESGENRPIRVKVLAFRGLATRGINEDPIIRIIRDAVTTIPTNRAATLPIPIEFLCDGAAKIKTDAAGKPIRDPDTQELIYESSCGDGLTCKAGKCVVEEVMEQDLAPYDPGEIFGEGTEEGDGTCFDTGTCLDGALELTLNITTFDADGTTCQATIPDAMAAQGIFNVGIETQGSGVCNEKGCYVPLDADSESGWKLNGTSAIVLPTAVCEKYKKAEIARVVGTLATPQTTSCSQKRSAIPTCGPWSSVGSPLDTQMDPKVPIILVGGQVNPNSLVVDTSGIYWTTQGDLVTNKVPGAVKMVPAGGGTPAVVADAKGAPQGLMVDPTLGFVYWTDATNNAQGTLGWAEFGVPNQPSTNALFEGLLQPGGVAAIGNTVYVTELGGNRVHQVVTAVDASGSLVKLSDELVDVTPAGVAPFSVVAAKNASSNPLVCFGYQGTPGNADGAVACKDGSKSVEVKKGLSSPRSLVFQYKDGNVTGLYWAEVDADGPIWHAEYSAGTFKEPQAIISPVSFPAGMAIDPKKPILYYTSKGGGTVHAFDLVTKQQLPLIAANRKNPVAVAVDSEFVYWVEGGTPNTKEGAIFKIAKPAQ